MAKDAKFIFPSDMNDMGASLAAADVKSKIPFHIRAVMRYIKYKIMGKIADSPQLLRFLADAERREPGVGRKIGGALVRWMANAGDFVVLGPGMGPGNRHLDARQVDEGVRELNTQALPGNVFGSPDDTPPFAGAEKGLDGQWHIRDYYGPGKHGTVEEDL